MKKIFLIVLVIIGVVAIHFKEDARTAEDDLKQKNFIVVSPYYSYEMAFDLEKEGFFSNDISQAVKGDKFYVGNKLVTKKDKNYFELRKKHTLYYDLVATKITNKEIRAKHFEVKQKVAPKLQAALKGLDENILTDKAIVSYNEDYLPTDVQFYDTVQHKWMVIIMYRYPYNTRLDYAAARDKCLRAILHDHYDKDWQPTFSFF